MNKNIINITSNALKQIENILKTEKKTSILFSVKSGGCNGFTYNLQPYNVNDVNKMDEIITFENIKIIVCHKSIFHLLGTTIDGKTDRMGQCFHFENPNATSKCGCGTSFG